MCSSDLGYLPENLFAPAPQSRMDGEWDERDMVGFARLMAAHRHEIAAVIKIGRASCRERV